MFWLVPGPLLSLHALNVRVPKAHFLQIFYFCPTLIDFLIVYLYLLL